MRAELTGPPQGYRRLGEFFMPVDLTKMHRPDRSKIAMSEEHEVKCWMKQVSKEGLQRARGSSKAHGSLRLGLDDNRCIR
jgi:hypothetical protein